MGRSVRYGISLAVVLMGAGWGMRALRSPVSTLSAPVQPSADRSEPDPVHLGDGQGNSLAQEKRPQLQAATRAVALHRGGMGRETSAQVHESGAAEAVADSDDAFVAAWAASSPSDAAGWVLQLEPGGARDSALATVAQTCAASAPHQAVSLAEGIRDAELRGQVCGHVAMVWSADAPEEALLWAKGLPEGAVQNRALEQVAISLAESVPVTAARLALEQIRPGIEQDRAVAAIVGRWAEHAPEAAAAWVQISPERPLRDAAMGVLMRSWVTQDPGAAAAWVDSLPQGSLRDSGLEGLGIALLPGTVEVVEERFQAISDPDRRDRLLAVLRRSVR